MCSCCLPTRLTGLHPTNFPSTLHMSLPWQSQCLACPWGISSHAPSPGNCLSLCAISSFSVASFPTTPQSVSKEPPAPECQFLFLSSYRPASLFRFQPNFPNCCPQQSGWGPCIKKNPILEGMSFTNKMCIRSSLMILENLTTSFFSHSEGSVKSTPQWFHQATLVAFVSFQHLTWFCPLE